MTNNIYKKATMSALRFGSNNYTVEQLWKLDLQHTRPDVITLDSLAKEVNKRLKSSAEDSFVTPVNTSGNTADELRLNILVDIIQTRQHLKEEQTNRNSVATEIKILNDALIASKQDELSKMSTKEIEALLLSKKAALANS